MLKRLPDLFYNFSSRPLDSDYLLVKNIWRRAQILVEYKSQVTLFTEENVRDGERPEDVATRLYRNPFYNWTILVINDITDVYAQWPKSVQQLQDFINQNLLCLQNRMLETVNVQKMLQLDYIEILFTTGLYLLLMILRMYILNGHDQ